MNTNMNLIYRVKKQTRWSEETALEVRERSIYKKVGLSNKTFSNILLLSQSFIGLYTTYHNQLSHELYTLSVLYFSHCGEQMTVIY